MDIDARTIRVLAMLERQREVLVHAPKQQVKEADRTDAGGQDGCDA